MSLETASYQSSQTGGQLPATGSSFHREEVKGFVPRYPIPWNKVLGESLRGWFTRLSYPYRRYSEIPFEDPLRSEVRRFLLSLDAYLESSNPVVPEKDILYGATHKDFAVYLKRVRRKAFQTTWAVDIFEYPEWWEEIPEYHLIDIGDIFNYAYCIHWINDEVDDIKASEEEVSITPRTLEEFRLKTRDLLESVGDIEEVSERDILSQITSSSSKENSKSTSRSPHYLLKPNHMRFAESIGTADRVILQVSPANERDSLIVNIESLNRISLIEQQTMNVLAKMKGHIHLKDRDRVSKRIYSLSRKYTIFIQRDLRKEGLTKPREILKVLLEELNRAFPAYKAYECPDFYSDLKIRDTDGKIRTYPRGHGLGMANALTTLMQLVIHEMVVDRTATIFPSADLSACLALNDDFTAAFADRESADEYWDQEMDVMTELSVIRANEKSFLSEHRYVIAERYVQGSTEHKKESYQRRELLLPLACHNKCHAKDYFSSVQLFVDFEYVNTYLSEMKSYWGYEFHQDEFDYPVEAGGWINQKVYGVSMSLKILDALEYDNWVPRAYQAAKSVVKKRPSGKMYKSPSMILYNLTDVPEEHRAKFDYQSENIINDRYGRIFKHSHKSFAKYWDKLQNIRLKTYKRLIKGMTYIELVDTIYKDHPTTQFYPAEHMIESYELCDTYSGGVSDPYLDPNPREAYVAKLKNLDTDFAEEFSISFVNADAYSKKKTSIYSKDVERTLKSEVLSLFFIGKYSEFYVPKDENFHPEEMYLNPIRVSAVAARLNFMGIPVLKEKYYHPLIYRKREVFGTLLTISEQILVSNAKISRPVIKLILSYSRRTGESVEEVLDYLDEKVEREPEPIKVRTVIYEDEEYDADIFKGILEKVREPSEDTIEINLLTLLSRGESLFWSWNSDPDGYTFTDDISSRICERLQVMLLQRSIGSSVLHASIERDIRDIEENAINIPFLCRFAQSWGILSYLKAEPTNLDLEDGACAGLWGEEEDW